MSLTAPSVSREKIGKAIWTVNGYPQVNHRLATVATEFWDPA